MDVMEIGASQLHWATHTHKNYRDKTSSIETVKDVTNIVFNHLHDSLSHPWQFQYS